MKTFTFPFIDFETKVNRFGKPWEGDTRVEARDLYKFMDDCEYDNRIDIINQIIEKIDSIPEEIGLIIRGKKIEKSTFSGTGFLIIVDTEMCGAEFTDYEIISVRSTLRQCRYNRCWIDRYTTGIRGGSFNSCKYIGKVEFGMLRDKKDYYNFNECTFDNYNYSGLLDNRFKLNKISVRPMREPNYSSLDPDLFDRDRVNIIEYERSKIDTSKDIDMPILDNTMIEVTILGTPIRTFVHSREIPVVFDIIKVNKEYLEKTFREGFNPRVFENEFMRKTGRLFKVINHVKFN